MTTFACFGSMISMQGLLIILGIALGIESILIGGIAFVISKVFGIRMRKILGAGAITLSVCGAVSVLWRWEGAAALTLSSAVVCGLLFAVGELINLIREGRKAGEEEDLRFLTLDSSSTLESAS